MYADAALWAVSLGFHLYPYPSSPPSVGNPTMSLHRPTAPETKERREWRPLTSYEEGVTSRLHKVARDSASLSVAARAQSSSSYKGILVPDAAPTPPSVAPVSHKSIGARHGHAAKRRRTAEVPKITLSVKVLPVQDMGSGVFAIKPISAGSAIIREKPFITFQDPLTSIEVWNALQSVSTDARDLFWGFSGTGAHQTTDVDIAETNLIPLEGESACGMFAMICRINHSCGPNARWLWDPYQHRMCKPLFSYHFEAREADHVAVIAFRDIGIGEEVTVSYLEPTELLSSDRREYMQTWFRFDCRCRICSASKQDIDQSDDLRQHAKASIDRWETFPIDEWYSSDLSGEENRRRTLDVMNSLEASLKDEGLWAFLPRLLEHKFMLYAAWGELEAAKSAGKQWEAEERKVEKGVSNEVVVGVRRDPREWGEWDKLRKLSVKLRKKTSRSEVSGDRLDTANIANTRRYGRKTGGQS